MLYVCSTWRHETLEFMWRELNIAINENDNMIHIFNPSFAKNFMLPGNAASIVRELNISVSLSSILSGNAYRLLSEFMGNTTSLPLVRKLLVLIVDSPVGHGCTKDVGIGNTLEFAQLLRSITRVSLASTEIKYTGEYSLMSVLFEGIFGQLSNVLCSNVKYSKIDLDRIKFRYSKTIDDIPMLTSLDLQFSRGPDLRTKLLHKCAHMLQDLRIGSGNPRGIIYDNNNNAVTYPNLQHLQINDREFRPNDRELAPNIVPFPSLKSVHILMDYPFADDVMFRGNSNTLEYLDFGVDLETMDMINKSLEFRHQRKCLKKVIVGEDYDSFGLAYALQADVTTLLSKLAGSAQMLKLSYMEAVDGLLAASPRTHGFDNIQLLDTSWTNISLFQILNLLRILPALKKLCCGSGGLGAELANIAYDEFPDHILSTYNNVGKHFYELKISFPGFLTRNAVAEFIMPLALACPRLCRITSSDPTSPNYRLGISEILDNGGPYSKYAPRFRRLLK
ncbi:hypothetical protein LPJ71_002003 [Coemansia sp. S17]|nr:hypothetical protein LPJ71_002003 [Coemansia sp. S17]